MSDTPATESTTIVCLATSRKHSGRCVAGLRVDTHEWVRPVSDGPYGEVAVGDCRLTDGAHLDVLDVVELRLGPPAPDSFQTENRLIDPDGIPWTRRGRLGWADLERLPRDERPLWIEPDVRADRVTTAFAATLTDSLRLIRVERLSTYVKLSWEGNRQVRGIFSHAGDIFDLVITDPWYEHEAQSRKFSDDEVDAGVCYLTVSLSHEYPNGYCFKLIAAVVTEARARTGGV